MMLSWLAFVLTFLFHKKPPSPPDKKRDPSSIVGIVFQGLSYAIVWTIRRPWFTAMFPNSAVDPGPSRGLFPTDPMLVNGPIVNRALLNRLYPPGTLTRNSATVQYDTPNRQMPRSTQVSFGYERQVGKT